MSDVSAAMSDERLEAIRYHHEDAVCDPLFESCALLIEVDRLRKALEQVVAWVRILVGDNCAEAMSALLNLEMTTTTAHIDALLAATRPPEGDA